MTSAVVGMHESVRRPAARLNIRVAGAMLLAVVSVCTWMALAGPRSVGATKAPAPRSGMMQLTQLPVAAGTLVSRTLGLTERRFWARPSGDGFVSAGGGLRASFTAAGVTVRVGGTRLRMRLAGYSAGGRVMALPPTAPTADRDRVTYAQGPVRGWYRNGPLGLEQGFTIAHAPQGADDARSLTLTLQLSGGVRAALDGGTIRFTTAQGTLLYRGLSARDGAGRTLPTHLGLRDGRLLLRVDVASARYPIVIDPLVELAKLTSTSHAYLGESVAVSPDGRTLVTGAEDEGVGGNSDQGAVFVFTKPSAGGWVDATQAAELTASDGANGDAFGTSVAISSDGGTIVVGAPDAGSNTGAAYVFDEPSGGWVDATQTSKLTAGVAGQDYFGRGVAVSHDGAEVVVGADGVSSNKGAAYVFPKPVGGWSTADSTPAATLTASDASASADFGTSVAISDAGAVLAVGAPDAHQVGAGYSGAVYEFTEPGSGWTGSLTQTAELTPSTAVESDTAWLGYATAIAGDGETIVSGAPRSTGVRGAEQGAVLVFNEPGSGSWAPENQAAVLTNSNASSNGDELGKSVSISDDGELIMAGAPSWTNGQVGQAYEYVKPESGWATSTETAILGHATGVTTDQFGYGVAAVDSGGAATLMVSALKQSDTPTDHAVIDVYGVAAAPSIASADTANFTVGSPGSFTVTTTGLPTPTLSESGGLPPGLSFKNNGDGTATIAGTPSATGVYPFTLSASNGVSPDAVQPFAITVSAATQTTSSPPTQPAPPTQSAASSSSPPGPATSKRPNTRITMHRVAARRRAATFRFKRIGPLRPPDFNVHSSSCRAEST